MVGTDENMCLTQISQETNLHLKEQMTDWTTKLERRGIKVLHKDNYNLILQTTNLLDTLFYVSGTNRRSIKNIMADDIMDD